MKVNRVRDIGELTLVVTADGTSQTKKLRVKTFGLSQVVDP
ncbi:MAG: hypothetical protein ACKOWJ_02670 [Micrococcales bacterium]